MAVLKVNLPAINENIERLNALMQKYKKQWSLVVKVLGSHRDTFVKLLQSSALSEVHSLGASHWHTLKLIKELDPEKRTLFIKPPAISNLKNIIKYADISFNSSASTIQSLNDEAGKRGIIHKIIVAVEMGELREGIHRDRLVEFYERIFNLPNIEVIGLGTNLGCMHGIRPTFDKLIQLTLYKQIIEYKFHRSLPLVSGGSSIALPLLEIDKVPEEMNHFRIGEAAFLGTSPFYNKRFDDLRTDTFEFETNILEIYKKENIPDGEITDAAIGNTVLEKTDIKDSILFDSGRSFKAVCDFGMLDVNANHLKPFNDKVKFFGNTSDMTVFDMGEEHPGVRTGDVLRFQPDYTAVANLMLAKYVEKRIID
jgi:predicted amino acid racemase